MINFLKELPDKYIAIFVLIVLLGFYARFQTTFFEQAVLFILGTVGAIVRGSSQQPAINGKIESQAINADPVVAIKDEIKVIKSPIK